MNKCLVLFVEGDTEVEFYKRVISNARANHSNSRLDMKIECKNVKGVGGFKNIALRKFVKEIKKKYDKDCEFIVALCRDTDVFELESKPSIKWNEVELDFIKCGAKKVIHIEARHSIEDWFLYDVESIVSFLHLPKKTKVAGNSGYDKLKRLYRQANKMYVKGMKSNGMISRLNIEKIVESVKDQLEPLYKELGL